MAALVLVASAACETPVEVERTNPLDPKGTAYQPAPPGDLRAEPRMDGARLTWTDTNLGEDGYLVERSDGDTDFVTLARLPADSTSFVDDAVAAFALRYRVSAFARRDDTTRYAAAEIDFSLGPSDLKVEIVDELHARLSWKDNTSFETGFVIYEGILYWEGDPSDALTVIAEVEADVTVFDDTSFVCVKYSGHRGYLIEANVGEWYSAPLVAAVDCEIYPPPRLHAEAIRFEAIRLDWSADSDIIAGFEVWRFDMADIDPKPEVLARLPATARSYVDRTLGDGYRDYRYQVRTLSGQSSNSVTAYTSRAILPVDTLGSFERELIRIAVTEDGELVAAAGRDQDGTGEVVVYDMAGGERLWRAMVDDPYQLEFDERAGRLVGLVGGDIVMWNAYTGVEEDAYRTSDRLTGFALAADVPLLAGSSLGGEASHVWDLSSGDHYEVGRMEPADDTTDWVPVRHFKVAFHPKGDEVGLAFQSGLQVFEWPSAREKRGIGACCYEDTDRWRLSTFVYSPDGTNIAAQYDDQVRIYQLHAGRETVVATFDGGNGSFVDGGEEFVTGPYDQQHPQPIRIWSMGSRQVRLSTMQPVSGDYAITGDRAVLITADDERRRLVRWEEQEYWVIEEH